MNRRSFLTSLAGLAVLPWKALQRPVFHRYLSAQIPITPQMLDPSRPGAFVQAMEAELQGLIKDMNRRLNSELLDDGRLNSA